MPEAVSRRSLPHWYRPGAAHFVTYRLAGSLPAGVLTSLRRRLGRSLAGVAADDFDRRAVAHKRAFAAYDRALHAAPGARHLADPRVAAVVAESLRHLDGRRFVLLAYCVMPNHVHAVFVPNADAPPATPEDVVEAPPTGALTPIMHSLKSYTAHAVNELLGRTGPFWQRESYDHWVRDDAELRRVVEYVVRNPVTAGLAAEPADWPWTWWDPERLV